MSVFWNCKVTLSLRDIFFIRLAVQYMCRLVDAICDFIQAALPYYHTAGFAVCIFTACPSYALQIVLSERIPKMRKNGSNMSANIPKMLSISGSVAAQSHAPCPPTPSHTMHIMLMGLCWTVPIAQSHLHGWKVYVLVHL